MVKHRKLKTNYPIKEDRYWVGTNGKVYWKDKSGKLRELKHFTTRDGYLEYVLTKKDGSKIHVQAQRLVIATYKGYPKDKNKTQVNHLNGVRTDNRPGNLKWVTPQENIRHSFDELGKVVWNSPKKN